MIEIISLQEKEQHAYFIWFCSYICIINAKKYNLPNIFILVLKNQTYKNLLKNMLGFETDFEIIQYFIAYDPSICKSKYCSKFLNSKHFKKIQHTFR